MSRYSARPRGLGRLYADLWQFAAGQRHWLIGSMLLLLAAQVVRLSVPALSGKAINTLQLQGLDGLWAAAGWLLLVFGATVVGWLFHGPGRLLERNVALTVRTRVLDDLIRKLLSLPLHWHARSHSAGTVHRAEQSSRALYDFAQSQFIYLDNAVRLIGPVAALWWIEPLVGVAALVGLLALSLSILGFDRAMMRLAAEENDAERRYNAAMIDAMGNVTSVYALRQARGVAGLIHRRLMAVYVPLRRSILLNEAKWCSVDLLSRVLSCALLALYAWLVARGLAHSPAATAGAGPGKTLPLGNIYMVWEYAQQAGGVISAVAAHFQTFARQQADYASGDVIREAAVERSAEVAAPATAWQRLEVRDLSFRHPGNAERLALDRLSFTLHGGRRYALIGGSGSGKSTLLQVLAGLYAAESGHLGVDGQQAMAADNAARWLRQAATLIPQDAEVFEGSLEENLALCETHAGPASPSTYRPALATACADDFLDTAVPVQDQAIAERGANFSGGQRQRIALARGVVAAADSSLLLLDEPTASLDPATERRVYENLFAAFPRACVVSSVHRLHLLDRFDAVLLMADGRLLDAGSVTELSARSQAFRTLLASQKGAA